MNLIPITDDLSRYQLEQTDLPIWRLLPGRIMTAGRGEGVPGRPLAGSDGSPDEIELVKLLLPARRCGR